MAPERPGPEDEPCVALRGVVSISDLPIYSLQGGQLRELREGDGASIELATVQSDQPDRPAGEDNDLTSLSWLQDKNLLKDMNLSSGVPGTQSSPTSDFVDDSASELADSTCSSLNSPPSPPPPLPPAAAAPRQKHPQHMPYDPQVHTSSKPPYSFSCLIFMAIEDSTQRALPVKDIYTWVLEHFPYFKNAPTGWKNSVRHNLSLNKCFRKVEKAPVSRNLGKGSLWMVDPMYRPNLLQALQKAPFHPYTTLDRINMVTSRHQSDPRPIAAAVRSDPTAAKANGRMPDPDLFPFLSRRLAASGLDHIRLKEESDSTDGESLDDVDAANAIMELKHGPRLLTPKREVWESSVRSPRKKPRLLQRGASAASTTALARGATLKPLLDALVITTSPSEDHTYSAGPTVAGGGSGTPVAASATAAVSPDEAYGEGSDTDDSLSPTRSQHYYSEVVVCKPPLSRPAPYYPPSSQTEEEQRRIAEGADALLNLAGITTRKRDYTREFSSYPTPSPSPKRVRKRHFSPPPTPPPVVAAPQPFRPRILRAARPKKEAKSRQRGNSRKRKTINNNNNNNLVVNGNAKAKVKINEKEWVRESRGEDRTGRGKR